MEKTLALLLLSWIAFAAAPSTVSAQEAAPSCLPCISADFDTGSVGRVHLLDSTCYVHRQPARGARTTVGAAGTSDSLQVLSYYIRSRWDPANPVDTAVWPSSRWFHFRLEGVRDKWIFLTIPNTEMQRPFYSYDGVEYRRFEAVEGIYPQSLHKIFTRDTVYVSYFIPYTHARHAAKAHAWAASPHTSLDTIGYSGSGLPIEMLTITEHPQRMLLPSSAHPALPGQLDTPDTATSSAQTKYRIWIHSRVHTSEAPAAWHLEALIDELLSDTPLACELRRRAAFYIVPEPNPDGVLGGYSRSTPAGVNLEIDWDRPDSLTTPEVSVLKRTIDSLTTASPFDIALNLHSQSAPFVTYWIHSAASSSEKMHRRKRLLSTLTMKHTPYYRPVDQRFSTLAPHYPEGWFWGRFGEQTLAITFETPYSYYNADPQGEWVSRENLAGLAHALLLALRDLLDEKSGKG